MKGCINTQPRPIYRQIGTVHQGALELLPVCDPAVGQSQDSLQLFATSNVLQEKRLHLFTYLHPPLSSPNILLSSFNQVRISRQRPIDLKARMEQSGGHPIGAAVRDRTMSDDEPASKRLKLDVPSQTSEGDQQKPPRIKGVAMIKSE